METLKTYKAYAGMYFCYYVGILLIKIGRVCGVRLNRVIKIEDLK